MQWNCDNQWETILLNICWFCWFKSVRLHCSASSWRKTMLSNGWKWHPVMSLVRVCCLKWLKAYKQTTKKWMDIIIFICNTPFLGNFIRYGSTSDTRGLYTSIDCLPVCRVASMNVTAILARRGNSLAREQDYVCSIDNNLRPYCLQIYAGRWSEHW